ncbi:uracil-DNA glycosylase, family 4 (plasmid) [Phaeobacter piscinae]|uniref:Type-4 uracil-DNA glycosylase n=1 Tax=Phaeobacter piscinae TaxID=1580596 RepID=A0ABN5DSK5_9RHOB|nr:UdgX family uracil-DNA binding protein [Phaeobacter piscinae]ATG37613.1 uracil-DNA glycosylase, family 4 [Phaeobacter piscinae]AUQ88134.1 uracil-DNA glycosylase, family 4 [Phaeobacter piscinae]AUR26017.1 uracil-DNA glycosylase, family 4 [Phaeobacter piscinae]
MYHAEMPVIGTGEAWRRAARGFLAQGVPPEAILWNNDSTAPDLFASQTRPPPNGDIQVPRGFVTLADKVVWHSDPSRFSRLYGFLWRLRGARGLMSDRGDVDLARLRQMEKAVSRCQHKMKAFVRFRELGDVDAPRRSFAAWFEPTHHTVEPTATFFARRFADMDWRILTPDVAAIFEGGELRFEPGHPRPELPQDASEQLWITYFRNIFNPARLKVQAMQSEMPKKYWKNMPEAAAIPELIATAPARARAMAEAAPTLPPLRAARVQARLPEANPYWQGPADELPAAINSCTRCPLYSPATQAVPGEGPTDADLMIVGEQPGDQEDLVGRPFVGPAGQLFDQLAAETGLPREAAYVTNAVKHFKFMPRGRKRLHQRPNGSEIRHCQVWLRAELDLVQPKLILALGATAVEALLGSGKDILQRRGTIEHRTDGTPVLITLHPSYLLRVPDPHLRAQATEDLRADLRVAADWLVQCETSGRP